MNLTPSPLGLPGLVKTSRRTAGHCAGGQDLR